MAFPGNLFQGTILPYKQCSGNRITSDVIHEGLIGFSKAGIGGFVSEHEEGRVDTVATRFYHDLKHLET